MTTATQDKLKETGKKLWHGVSREEFVWYPKVDGDICDGCSICILSCGNSVFKWSISDGKPLVALPQNCVFGCTTCGKLCPRNAISFPEDPKVFLRAATIRYKVFPVVKQELEARLTKFPDHDLSKGSEHKYGN
jgi:NAD-dependent dihydropyrimidine dehydrogenase PreA subunit